VCLRHGQGRVPDLPEGAVRRDTPDAVVVDLPEGSQVDAFLRAVLAAEASVISVTPRRESLEDLFVRQAQEQARAGKGAA
jgi:hypothetical protein